MSRRSRPRIKVVAALALALVCAETGSGAAQARQDDISSMKALLEYDRSRKLSDSHEFAGQLSHLKKAIEYAPDSAILYSELGFCYLSLKQPGTARTYLDKAVKLDPNCREILSRRAFACLIHNDLQSAITDLRKCLAINKVEQGYLEEGPDAQNLARALSHTKMRGQTPALEKQYAVLIPLFAAMEARDEMRLAKALSLASKVVAEAPDRAVARWIKAVLLLDMSRFREAESELDILLRKDPANATLLYFRAEARRLSANNSGALADYDKILESGRMFIARKLTAGTGKHRDNRVYYDDWIITPADIYYLKASIYKEQNDPLKAQAAIEQACLLSPDDADSLIFAANIAVERKQLDKAREFAGRMRRSSASSERIKDIDLFIQSAGSPAGRTQALAAYRIWMKQEANSPAVLYVIARRLESMKEYKDASQCWSALSSVLGREADPRLHLAFCLLALGEKEKAAAAIAEAKKLGASEQNFKRVGLPSRI